MSLLSRRSKSTNKAARRRRPSLRPDFELLEDRRLLAPLDFLVTNNADSGPGSLRQAIIDANTTSGADTIGFNIAVGAISEVATPTTGSSPADITVGPDGNLWFTEQAGAIGRIATDGTITEFATPAGSDPTGITAGPDGNLWFTELSTGRIGRITTAGAISEFPIFAAVGRLTEITAGPDGNLWFTEYDAGKIGRITTTGILINEFSIPTIGATPDGITTGPDGNLWFTEGSGGNKIGRITTAGVITEFPTPTANSTPIGITTGPDGNLWFTEGDPANKIGRITTAGIVTEFPTLAAGSRPVRILTGSDGNLWFTEQVANQIGRITTTGIVTEFPIPTADSRPAGITAGPDGNLWFTERNGNKIGRVTVSSSGLTISPTSALPDITDPVTIDGYSQPGAGPNTLAVGDNAVLLIDLSGAAAGIGVDGLVISAGGSTVRGLIINDFVAGPIITPGFIPNGGKGISLGSAGGNTIVGNYIGTDASGGIARPNTFSGVLTTTAGNQIGGTAPGDRNVISGNNVGIFFLNAGASGNLLQGNYIGVNAAGTADLGNTNVGVQINNAPGNTIGGTLAGARNVISGNDLGGIGLANSSASGNLVQGNFIGTDASGTTALGNGFGGVSISDAPNNTIGGANTIAFNSGPGVQVNGSNARGNSILSNSIYSNTGLGIVLTGGANNNQAAPTLTAAASSGGTTTLSGTLNSTPNATFTVQFFANAAPDPSGFGEGQQFLGQLNNVTTDGAGNASFSATLSTSTLVGGIFTATATDPAGNTSEFSQDISSGTTVTNTNDSGPDSLRQAILNANANPGLDKITFDISGAGVHTISPASALPAITDPVVIDGYTQPGASPNTLANGDNGVLLIELDGSNAGASVDGLVIAVGGSTVRGLVINRFVNGAINIVSDNNAIEGNFIGTDPSGTVALGILTGVTIDRGSGNTVGGTTPAARNLISGNSLVMPGLGRGVRILEGSSNVIAGNYIGTDAAGTRALPNSDVGVLLDGVSTDNTIGGTTTGARNVISGNGTNGVEIINAGSTRNLVAGNYIGIDAAGSAALGNGTNGVLLDAAAGNTVGGTGTAANTIGGNVTGIYILGSGATGNVVLGNFIGTDASGANLGNVNGGIFINNAPNNTIGGANTIGRNGSGIIILGSGATGNVVLGNYIGTDASGDNLGNGGDGVLISDAPNNTIGGANTIGHNGGRGIEINDSIATGNVVLGNYIGTDASGDNLGNGGDGIYIGDAPNNTVGGAGNAANTIGFNFDGIDITGSGATGNVVLGNFIGTNASGDNLGNVSHGIVISGAPNNTIGGANIIGYNNIGIDIIESGATGNVVLGNFIGTNIGGANLGNQTGVLIERAPNNTIGGAATNIIGFNHFDGINIFVGATGNVVQGNFIGTNASGGNLGNGTGVRISGSNNTIGGNTIGNSLPLTAVTGFGIFITGSFATGNVVQGNLIGTNTGGANLGNSGDGVLIDNAPNNTIGGTTSGAGNVISGNCGCGVHISGPAASGNHVQGNFIGTDATGENKRGNSSDGIWIDNAPNNSIGGTEVGAGNIISGNSAAGVHISGPGASGNQVQGNFIGIDATGERAVPNSADGVLIDGSSNNTIGGTAVGAGNVISGNIGAGVNLDPGATKNVVLGNFIGTDATGELAVPNRAAGVLIGESSNNTIGGTAVGARNVISYNIGDGVSFALGATKNVVQGNTISANSGAGVSFALGATNNVVQGNVISGNIGGGVSGPGAANNVISGNGVPNLPPPSNTQPSILLVGAQNSSLALIATLVVTSFNGGESQNMSTGSATASVSPNQATAPSGKGGEGGHAADESGNPQGGLSSLIPTALRPWVLVLLGTNEALARIRGAIPDLFTSGDGQQGPVGLLSRAYQAILRSIDEAIPGVVLEGLTPSLRARTKGRDIDELAGDLAREGSARTEPGPSAVPVAAGPATDPAEVLPDTSKSTLFRLVDILAVSVASIGALAFTRVFLRYRQRHLRLGVRTIPAPKPA